MSEYKNTTSYKDLDKKGQYTVLRLIRQLKKETTSYMSLSQNTSRIAKLIRELANTRIFIQEMKIVGSRTFLSSRFKRKENKLRKKEEKTSFKILKNMVKNLKQNI